MYLFMTADNFPATYSSVSNVKEEEERSRAYYYGNGSRLSLLFLSLVEKLLCVFFLTNYQT